MNGNPKINPAHHYGIDEDDLEELDDISLTSDLNEAIGDFDVSDSESDTGFQSHDQTVTDDAGTTMDEVSIDELLASMSPDYQNQLEEAASESDLEDTGTFDALEILISPKELFPDEH